MCIDLLFVRDQVNLTRRQVQVTRLIVQSRKKLVHRVLHLVLDIVCIDLVQLRH